MLDFVNIVVENATKGRIIIYPEFINKPSKDLMIRGGSFYAVWDEKEKLWCTDEYKIEELVDEALWAKYHDISKMYEADNMPSIKVLLLSNNTSKRWLEWKNYSKGLPDKYKPLDSYVVSADYIPKKSEHISKKLPYAIAEGDCAAYNELMSTLYDPEERDKLEWAIGSIISGDSTKIQKFIVLYGEPGSGKSTVLNIIQMLFEGYWAAFDAKALGQANNAFALEAFRTNPLVAIQHDGDLSRIEDNTRINQIVAHETMLVNEKRKTQYSARFNSFLFMGTNKPVKITDAKSGILRRLIDVSPSGRRLPKKAYSSAMKQIEFELGAIAYHCLKVYENLGDNYYDSYKPKLMMNETNDFYNFMLDNFEFFAASTTMTLNAAWKRYKDYCEDAAVNYPFSKRAFKNELRNYYEEFKEKSNGLCNVFRGFREDKIIEVSGESRKEDNDENDYGWLDTLTIQKSIFDEECSDCKAQYATGDETPLRPWAKVETKLKDLDTSKVHYVHVPSNHIVIDFDLKGPDKKKSLELNLAAASKWPKTYAEISKGGAGLHLHYIYDGDVSKLSNEYDANIEVKLPIGDSALRRKLTKCTAFAISKISSGLILKGVKKVVDKNVVHDEKWIRKEIVRSLKKQHHGATKPEVDWIDHILEEAYSSGMKFDVSDMRPDIEDFAFNSTNNKKYCEAKVEQMKFKSEAELPANSEDSYDESPIVIFDVEVAPNKFLLVWKYRYIDGFHVMKDPKPEDVEALFNLKLVGFNNRDYDNHILYGWAIDHLNNEGLYNLSQRIIGKKAGAKYGAAYNLSYADIFEFSSKKQSLKKWEIELGIHHKELGIPWDQPITEELEQKWIEYCCNDVSATEALLENRKADFDARLVLTGLSGLTVNDTTRTHITQIIFGNDKNPKLVYTDLSIMFPGYTFDKEKRKSSYRGEDPGEGGYVYAEPGIYTNVALLDIASMHPTSIILLNLFGEYTPRYKEILDARIAVKHRDYEYLKTALNGALVPFLGSDKEMDDLSYALKIIANSTYGYTTATFPNVFKDEKNVDNIVAKRGALFMINLKHEVQDRGFKVAHIKTDSIKIPNATPEIISFVMEYGKQYGYTFEHEATYERMCLVNDAVYIAKYADGEHEYKLSTGEKIMTAWTATGTQFQVPFVFKQLFSKHEIIFNDLCETKSTSKGLGLYLDMNEDLPEDEHNYIFVGKVGRFTPIKKGCGGGLLVREANGKYNAATGTKGYRWLESESVEMLGKKDDADKSYYISLCDAAIDTINKFGSFDRFVADEPYVDTSFMNIPEDANDEVPW